MTFSIYFANFFAKNDVNEFLLSMNTQTLTHELTQVPGAPGCTIFKTMTKDYPFCFADESVRQQIQAAAIKFLNCRSQNNGGGYDLTHALSGCDLEKVDLSVNGPFGASGPKIKEVYDKMRAKKQEKKIDWTGVNPYYIAKGVPGDEVKEQVPLNPVQNSIDLNKK
jgi:hypothetical protein